MFKVTNACQLKVKGQVNQIHTSLCSLTFGLHEVIQCVFLQCTERGFVMETSYCLIYYASFVTLRHCHDMLGPRRRHLIAVCQQVGFLGVVICLLVRAS